jgi:hypothetical protein
MKNERLGSMGKEEEDDRRASIFHSMEEYVLIKVELKLDPTNSKASK